MITPSAPEIDERVRENTGLVYYAARRFYPVARRYEDYDDCVQDGMVGLVKAARRFDDARGWQFSTYAHHRILGSMHDGLRRIMGTRDWGKLVLPASLDRVARWDPDGSPVTLAGLLPHPDPGPDEQALALLWPSELHRYLARLPTRERLVLERCVLGGEQLRALAPVLGVCVARVSQLKRAGLNRMAAMLAAEGWFPDA